MAATVTAVAAPSARAAAEPRLLGTCPTDGFYSIAGARRISLARACSIGIAARKHGAVECYSPPGSQYPIAKATRRSFRGYSLTNTLYGIRFVDGATRFIFGIQCS